MNHTLSERALLLAPLGRDAAVAADMLRETGISSLVCADIGHLVRELNGGAGLAIITEEAVGTTDLRPLKAWIGTQQEWSDFPFVLLTRRGGGLERNPAASRYLDTLGNVTFLERPFHPTTLVSLAHAALRGRRRQYEARARLEALRASETRYRQIVEGAEDFAIVTLDGNGTIVSWNTGAERITQFMEQEVLGLPGDILFTPDDRSAGLPQAEIEHVRSEGRAIDERWLQRKDGSPFWSSGLVMQLDHPSGGFLKIFRDRTAEHRAELEIRELNETLEARVRARTLELEHAQEALRQSQKMEAMGNLTGGVAHDFNNLLTPIIGGLDLLQRQLTGERELRLIGAALQSADRAKTLVQRLLAFARRQPLQAKSVDLRELVRGMAELMARTSGPRVKIKMAFPPNLPPVRADPHQLELAILNLAVNARDAMHEGGTLTLAATEQSVVGCEIADLTPGRYIHLQVTDTGTGMDEETLARAIEPFFSTKGVGQGTGLGLSMVHGLAAQMGGAMEIASKVGEGTGVNIWLPVSEEAAIGASDVAQPAPSRHFGKVLLVDDEPLILMSTSLMLTDMGFSVTEASSAEAALRIIADGFVPDVLITDHLMPGMTGTELAAEVKRQFPNSAILLISGYAQVDGIASKLPRLTKPFHESDLSRILEELQTQESA